MEPTKPKLPLEPSNSPAISFTVRLVSPGLDVGLEKISIIANELGCSVLATVIKELRSAN